MTNVLTIKSLKPLAAFHRGRNKLQHCYMRFKIKDWSIYQFFSFLFHCIEGKNLSSNNYCSIANRNIYSSSPPPYRFLFISRMNLQRQFSTGSGNRADTRISSYVPNFDHQSIKCKFFLLSSTNCKSSILISNTGLHIFIPLEVN